jgi:hypothetical protein
VVGILAGMKLLRDIGFRERRPFDPWGLALIASGLPVFIVTLSRAAEYGLVSAPIVSGLLVGMSLMGGFVWVESRNDNPLIDISMFKIRTFSLTVIIVWILTSVEFTRLVFVPLELIGIRGFTALEVGLMLAPAAVATATTMLIGGRLADRMGPKVPVTTGLAVIGLGLFLESQFALDTPVWGVITAMAIQGAGTGFALTPNTLAAMDSVTAPLVAQASTVRSLNRQIAGAVSVALLTSVIVARIGVLEPTGVDPQSAQNAYNSVFVIATGATLAAFVIALRLPGKAETMRVRSIRQAEHDALPTET